MLRKDWMTYPMRTWILNVFKIICLATLPKLFRNSKYATGSGLPLSSHCQFIQNRLTDIWGTNSSSKMIRTIKPLLSMLSDLSLIKSSSNLGIPSRLLTVNTKANNSFSFSAKTLFSLSTSFTSWSSINLIDLRARFLPLMCLKKFLLLVFMPLASYSSKLFLSSIIMVLHLTCQNVLGLVP